MRAYVLELADEERAFLLFEDGEERGVWSSHSDGIRALVDHFTCPVIWLKSDMNGSLRRWFEIEDDEEKLLYNTAHLHEKAQGKEIAAKPG